MFLNKVSAAKVEKLIKTHPGILYRHMLSAFAQMGQDWRAGMDARFSGGPIRSRTGKLQRGLRHRVTGSTFKTLKLTMSSGSLPYAAIQEFGGTITPKNAQYLTVPLSGVLGGESGKVRLTARQAIERGAFFFRTGGKLFIARRKGKGLQLLFVLKKSVELKPRLGMREVWESFSGKRKKLIDRALKSALADSKRAGGGRTA